MDCSQIFKKDSLVYTSSTVLGCSFIGKVLDQDKHSVLVETVYCPNNKYLEGFSEWRPKELLLPACIATKEWYETNESHNGWDSEEWFNPTFGSLDKDWEIFGCYIETDKHSNPTKAYMWNTNLCVDAKAKYHIFVGDTFDRFPKHLAIIIKEVDDDPVLVIEKTIKASTEKELADKVDYFSKYFNASIHETKQK